MTTDDPHDLNRFVRAQEHDYTRALACTLCLVWHDALPMAPFDRHSAVYRRRPRQRLLPFPLQITRPLAS
jgi:hypothetical protein